MAMRLAGLVLGMVLLASAMAWGQSGVQEIQVLVPGGTIAQPAGIVDGARGFQVTVSTGNAGVYYGSGYYGGYPVGYGYGGYPVTYGYGGYPVTYGYPVGYPNSTNGCGYPPAGYGYPTFGGYQVNPYSNSVQISPGTILFPAAPSVNGQNIFVRPGCAPQQRPNLPGPHFPGRPGCR